jgi:lipopolysaccharide/colanic/teichoic acid biosynthesis glycosyltransferase
MKLPASSSSNNYGRYRADSPIDRQSPDCPCPVRNSEHSIDGDPAEPSRAEIPQWKRFLDLAVILVTLPFWFSLFVAIAVWIKLVSPGPFFYFQQRIGYRGRKFQMFKFRTMKVNVETGSHERHFEQLMQADTPMTKLDARDPRIIWGGRFIRATGLDELPQLLNVLRRDMTLVGPRPCTTQEFQKYLPWQRERTNVVPGITGYWQVNGKNRTTFTQMIEMDIYYTNNMSLGLDVAVLLKTPQAVVSQVLETRFFVPQTGSSATIKPEPEPRGSVPSIPCEQPEVPAVARHLQPAE